MTARALERFIDEHESGVGETRALAKRKKWIQGDSNKCVIDLCYLFSYMLERLDEAAEMTAKKDLDQLVKESLKDDEGSSFGREKISETEQKLTSELLKAHGERREEQEKDRNEVDGGTTGAASKRRRRYFGWRAVFGLVGRALRWVGRTVKNAFEWIVEKIRKLVHYATALVNYIREKTRRAVRLVALGLQRLHHWITGKPVSTVRGDSFVATKWSLDFDTINVVAGLTDPAHVRGHLTRIDCLNAGFGFLVEVALSIWSVVQALAAPFINWLLLAWRAFKAVRRCLQYADDHAALLDRLEPAVS
jgi:hypothetical protein